VEVREEVRQLAQPLAEDDGFELVDVELSSLGRHRVIRVYLDKPGGVSLGDCARFSRRLSDCLDMNQTIPGSFHLEVSSPGLERSLRTLEHVERFAGQRVSLTTHEPLGGRRRWDGVLIGVRDGCAGVRVDEGEEHWFEWAGVRTARLVVDPWEGLRNPKGRPTGSKRPRGGSR
jgi:ribosome maturation factor RimP